MEAPIAGESVDGVDGDADKSARRDSVGSKVGGYTGLTDGEGNGRDEAEAFAGYVFEVGQMVWVWKILLHNVVSTC